MAHFLLFDVINVVNTNSICPCVEFITSQYIKNRHVLPQEFKIFLFILDIHKKAYMLYLGDAKSYSHFNFDLPSLSLTARLQRQDCSLSEENFPLDDIAVISDSFEEGKKITQELNDYFETIGFRITSDPKKQSFYQTAKNH